MTEAEILAQWGRLFEADGWTLTQDHGEHIARRQIGPNLHQSIYRVRQMLTDQKLEAILSVGLPTFSKAVAQIMDRTPTAEPLVQTNLRCKVPQATQSDLRALLSKAGDWLDRQRPLDAVAKLTTDYSAFGSGPLYHLAALALSGETARLIDIRARFEIGDKTGFLPYLALDHVDRALKIAEAAPGG